MTDTTAPRTAAPDLAQNWLDDWPEGATYVFTKDQIETVVASVRFHAGREAIEPLLALVRAARLSRNHLLADGDTFGTEEWIAVPREDFDALRDAVSALDPAIVAAARKP